jgi:capsular polysaccharide biosynthesis protein
MANHSPYFEKVCEELFPNVKIVVMPKGETWQFKHLIVPSMSNVRDGVTTPGLAPWLRHFKGLTNIKGVKPHRKIVLLRPGAKSRRMLNSDELLLKLKGWETVTLEDLSIKDQIKTFAEASHVLAAHGAGMVNLLWCHPGTKVIEIQDKNMLHKKVYPLLSHNLDLEHKLYLADVVEIPRENGNKLDGVKRFSDMINFKINIPEIMEHLE